MPNQSDAQLLREYVAHGSEHAFREIVVRHTGLVYSAALRQCGSPELAREIAQNVFTDLVRKARTLAPQLTEDASLAGWLYRGTRYAALNLLRVERRRQVRERLAMEDFNPADDTAPDWDLVAPVLDEAMAELGDTDREAVLLRYFQNHDFAAVGRALGVSDDAAQKRVSRAVDRLREFLARRGVTIGASGLVILISANGVLTAPAGLSAALLASALGGTATVAATQVIAMTTLQKTALAAGLIAATAIVFYEAHQARAARRELEALEAQQAPLAAQLEQLTRDKAAAARELAALRSESQRTDSNIGELARLRNEVTQLRRQLAPLPVAAAPGRIPLVAHVNVTIAGPAVPGTNAPPVAHAAGVRALISVKAGDPFSRLAIDRDVRALYGTGCFANVRVLESRTNDDYILDYQIQEKPRPAIEPGKYISTNQLAFAGYDTPEAALQSALWAGLSGNFDIYTNSIKRSIGDQELDREEFMNVLKTEPSPIGIQILARKSPREDWVELKVKVDMGAAAEPGIAEINITTLARQDGAWKILPDVHPAVKEWEKTGTIQNYTP